MGEKFNLGMKTETINRARQWVQHWQRSWSSSGSLQAGRNGNGGGVSFLWLFFFPVRISASAQSSRVGLGTRVEVELLTTFWGEMGTVNPK